MSAAPVRVVMVSGSMNFSDIVAAQVKDIVGSSVFSWNWLPLFPILIVYLISTVAETNHAPSDIAEGESEIVTGYHVEYPGFVFAPFFLTEYIFMILTTALTSLIFLSGWPPPFPQSWDIVGMSSAFWMFVEMAAVLYWYLWMHATFPRYRCGQIVHLSWKVLIPTGFVYTVVLGLWMISSLNLWE